MLAQQVTKQEMTIVRGKKRNNRGTKLRVFDGS
jgi:hypothetical protein